jgi:hypothetical protein
MILSNEVLKLLVKTRESAVNIKEITSTKPIFFSELLRLYFLKLIIPIITTPIKPMLIRDLESVSPKQNKDQKTNRKKDLLN